MLCAGHSTDRFCRQSRTDQFPSEVCTCWSMLRLSFYRHCETVFRSQRRRETLQRHSWIQFSRRNIWQSTAEWGIYFNNLKWSWWSYTVDRYKYTCGGVMKSPASGIFSTLGANFTKNSHLAHLHTDCELFLVLNYELFYLPLVYLYLSTVLVFRCDSYLDLFVCHGEITTNNFVNIVFISTGLCDACSSVFSYFLLLIIADCLLDFTVLHSHRKEN